MSAKGDCEKLMNAMLPLAERMLSEFGEFYPYGGYMNSSGEIVDVGAKDEEDDHPKSKDLLYVLRQSLLEMAVRGDCKATAMVFDVRVVPPGSENKGDAVQICLEHIEGYSAEVFMPYEIDQSGRITYGAMFAQAGKRDIFEATRS
jgi:hypothetical protein